MKEIFISAEFDKKLCEAFDLLQESEMAKLDEEMKNATIIFSDEFEEKMKQLFQKNEE